MVSGKISGDPLALTTVGLNMAAIQGGANVQAPSTLFAATANNLSDLGNPATALANLGGLSAALAASTYLTQAAAVAGYQPLAANLTSWAAVTRAAGFDTFTASPSSANFASLLTDKTGTGLNVFATSPTLVTPAIGVATATSVNKVAITAPATSATLTIPDGVTLTGPAASGTAMTLGNTETVTGVKTFGSAGAVGRLKLAGTTSGTTTLDASAVASGTLTLPAATDTLVGKATTDTLTNKTFDTAGTGNSLSINGVAATANTGTGAVVRAAAPTLTGIPVFSGIPLLTGGAISFPSTQVPSAGANDLDDYEENSWTPDITFALGNTGITYGTRVGKYVKIGQLVCAFFDFTLTAKGSSTGPVHINSFPFTSLNDGLLGVVSISFYSGMSGLTGGMRGYFNINLATADLVQDGAAAATNLTEANFTNTSRIAGVAIYRAA